MSEVTLNLSDYKSSGVYFVEVDNSIVQGTAANSALRLAVGYNEKGPFNRPIYLSSTAECDELLGGIDKKLERRGCYTNRNIRTMVAKAPVYAINLLPIDSSDNTSYINVSFGLSANNDSANIPFKDMFDRTKFWVADSDSMMKAIQAARSSSESSAAKSLFAFGNCGTEDMSLIVRKAEGLKGYDVTFMDWYGGIDAIPYKWINPYDYVSDYFVQVVAVAGQYNNYAALAVDPFWKAYFDTTGIKRGMLNKFLRLDAVRVIGNWTGCIIPDFFNKRGICMSLDYQINKVCNKTGLMFGVNQSELDGIRLDGSTFVDGDDASIDNCSIDITGVSVDPSTLFGEANNGSIDFMSYSLKCGADLQNSDVKFVDIFDGSTGKNECEFVCSLIASEASSTEGSYKRFEPAIGDYIRAADGTLAKIIKKRVTSDNITYTASAAIDFAAGDIISQYSVSDDFNIPNVEETTPETPGNHDYMVYGESAEASEEFTPDTPNKHVEIHQAITSVYETLKFLPLTGLKIGNKHRPGYDADGVPNVEAGVAKIYNMLADSGIRKGLLNLEAIDYRYIVDTMSGGLEEGTGCKAELAKLAQEKGSCTALINLPSMTDFAASTAPSFRERKDDDAEGAFAPKYIADGGNFEVSYSDDSVFQFSLPSEEDGAKFAAYFAPYLKYNEGIKTILVPPAADVCNTFINKYLGGDPYTTVANLNGILRNGAISGLEYDFDREDRDALEPFGVNPIISRGGSIMIYGDRTAYQTVDSDFNFLHVRELLNTIEYKCRSILNDYVFTYNNAATRAEIASRLDPILRAMKDSGALAKYELQIDDLNNTKEIIDQKVCIVDIGVWVTPNMEKIITRLTVNRGAQA